MKWGGFFKKDKGPDFDPTKDAVLDRMKPGFMVDYDMKTWQVTDTAEYDMGEGYRMIEWELTAGSDVLYLNLENYDGACWSLTRKVPTGMLGINVRQYITENEDPPAEVTFKDEKYYLDASGNAEYYSGENPESEPFIYWEYEDESGKKCLTIEQWSDTDFECYAGDIVEEYQFSNILPGQL